MATKVGEFFVELAVDAASGNLSVKQLVGALGELDVASVGTVGVISKVADTLVKMAMAATQTAVELTGLAEVTGAEPKLVQQWEKAAERVLHHSGTITKAIRAVNEMNKGLSIGQAPPAALTGILGLSPYRTNAEGKTVTKDALEYLKELAAPGSTYRTRGREVQQAGLNALFPGAGEDIYRILNAMIAGKFHPEEIRGMDNQTVKDLNRVDEDRIKIGQQMTDIFQQIITHGGDVANALEAVSKGLTALSAFLEENKKHSYTTDVKNIRAGLGDPAVAADLSKKAALFYLNSLLPVGPVIDALMEKRAGRSVAEPRVNLPAGAGAGGELRGKLDISLTTDGKPRGNKTAFVDRTATSRDFWSVTDQLGNTP